MHLNSYKQILPETTVIQTAEKKFNMSRKKIYWLSQLSGWFLFVIVNIIVAASFEKLNLPRLELWLLIGFVGIVLTHLLRKVIRKRNWLNLSLGKGILTIISSSVVSGIIYYGIVFALSQLLHAREEEFKIGQLIAGFTNLSAIIFFWSLVYFAVHYFENYKKKEIESLIWEAAVKDYELKTLKSQLNPHFMFNAMNSIRALIEEDPESAKTAITKLSNLLRYSLKMERMEMVPFEDEMENVKDYLDLERIRFEERLKYHLDIDSRSKKIEIPPMMIQTLVENGIKHGVSKRTEGGEISVVSKVLNSHLHVEIKNSGHFVEEDLKKSKGFGVSNTRHRLSLIYGTEAKFEIKNENLDKVVAEIEFPI
jgi:two-component system, LytTR family, sensor kinase